MKLETGLVTGSEIKKNKDGKNPVRLLQVVISDPDDVQTAEWIGKLGEDDGVAPGMTVLILAVGSTKFAFAADDGIVPDAQNGEKKLYSLQNKAKAAEINLAANSDIELKSGAGANINLRENGDVELNGTGDFVISFNQLKTILEQFVSDINTELNKRELIPGQTPLPLTIDITAAKKENIKIEV